MSDLPHSYKINPEIVEHILKTPSLIDKLEKTLLEIWDENILDEIISSALWTKEAKIELILAEGYFNPGLDELREYFDFNYYPDHMQPLIDAKLIPPLEQSTNELYVSSKDMENQPKLF